MLILWSLEMPLVVTTECFRLDIMGHVVKSASPYLYPCTIQYSLIAAGKLYKVINGTQQLLYFIKFTF